MRSLRAASSVFGIDAAASFVGGQMIVFFRPFVSLVWANPRRWDQVQRVLEDREAVEALAVRLEARM